MSASTPPTPLTWTLRLKSHRTTVVLHVTPLTTFSTIKTHLFTALQETSLRDASGDIISLPISATDIQLGNPKSTNDLSRGFVLGRWEEGGGGEESWDDLGEGVPSSKGKGKAPEATKGKGKPKKESGVKAGVNNCPKGAGLKDGAVLAFRWVGDGMWDGETNDEQWGVRIASFEETYAEEAPSPADVEGLESE